MLLPGRLCRQARLTVWDVESEKAELTSDIPNPGFCRFSILPTPADEGMVKISSPVLLVSSLLCCSLVQASSGRQRLWEGVPALKEIDHVFV